jgi:hypothetical protein
MSTQNQNNIYPKPCNYGCNTQIYWNASVRILGSFHSETPYMSK